MTEFSQQNAHLGELFPEYHPHEETDELTLRNVGHTNNISSFSLPK